jgi:hypothetical protein
MIGGELNSGKEISGKFVIACGDGAKVLEFIEEALNQVTLAVESKITWEWLRAAGM